MEPTPEQAAEGIVLVQVLAAVLERLVSANAPLALADPGQVTKFHALKAPGIAILQYLERIHKYASCSNECFVLALIYIDRLIQRNNFLLTDLNVHRVVITAILLAAKFFDDAYYNNAYYAKVGGVLVTEMNGLEVDFLFRINFSLHVTPQLFAKYREELVSHSSNSVILPHLGPQPGMPEVNMISSPTTVHAIPDTFGNTHVNPQLPTHPQDIHFKASSNLISNHESKFITPSPPDTAGKPAMITPSGAELMTNLQTCPVPMAVTVEPASGIPQQGHPHRSNSLPMPPYQIPQYSNCSRQQAYTRMSSLGSMDCSSVIATGPQHFAVYDGTTALPFGGATGAIVIRHNPGIKIDGYMPQGHHTDPGFAVKSSDPAIAQWHILTGCTSGS